MGKFILDHLNHYRCKERIYKFLTTSDLHHCYNICANNIQYDLIFQPTKTGVVVK